MIKKVVSGIENFIHKIMDKIGEDKFWKYFLLIFFLLSLVPFFVPGIFWGHDVHFHLSRVEGIAAGLKSGAFPVLVYPGYFAGYGYGNGIFYPDIFLYIPALLKLIGLSTINAYKIFLFLITCGILFSMYFCVKKITKSTFTATMISVLYLMSSYRITDMWIRSAAGETLTFVFFPFVILGLYELIYGNEKNWKYFTFGLVGVVLSHLISGVFCILLVIVFGLVNIKKLFKEKKRLKNCLISGMLAVGISAFFTFPLLEAMLSDTFNYSTLNLTMPISERSVNPLLSFIEVPTGVAPWTPQGIGLVFIYLFFRFFKKKVKEEDQRKFKNVCLVMGFVLLFATTSLFPWKIAGKFLGVIQFPWRFYILVIVLLLFAFAILISNSIKSLKDKIHLSLILTIFICFTYSVSSLYLFRFGIIDWYKSHVVVSAEYVPVDVNTDQYKERGEVITSNNSVITKFNKNGTFMNIDYEGNNYDNSYLELPLMYYKGYVAKQNDKDLTVEKGNNGLVRIYLNQESGNIQVYYGITKIRKIGIACSILTVIIFAGTLITQKKENNEEKQ